AVRSIILHVHLIEAVAPPVSSLLNLSKLIPLILHILVSFPGARAFAIASIWPLICVQLNHEYPLQFSSAPQVLHPVLTRTFDALIPGIHLIVFHMYLDVLPASRHIHLILITEPILIIEESPILVVNFDRNRIAQSPSIH